MGRRISVLPDQPTLKDNDYLVVDGESGTRKVPATESIVLAGVSGPPADKGIVGSMYIQYNNNADKVVGIFFKSPNGWIVAPTGGGSSFKQMLDEDMSAIVTSTSTITITGEVNP